jgi:hypothetical protein
MPKSWEIWVVAPAKAGGHNPREELSGSDLTASLRAKRSYPDFLRGTSLDCRVASLLAMTEERVVPSNHSLGLWVAAFAGTT